MSTSREIVTLQFGSYANHVGAHWWNIQESGFSYDPQGTGTPSEVNPDVLYREGVNLTRQTTYTPRLLLVELDGGLKHLPQEGELYGNSLKRSAPIAAAGDAAGPDELKKLREELEWQESDIEVVAKPEAARNAFQADLDNPEVNVHANDYKLAANVESWADYLYARYHPRTAHVVRQYKYSPVRETFDTHSSGVALWKSEQFEEEFCDKIRQYVEECDFLQGFQSIFDAHNGHSGLATQCMAYLNDEYSKANFAVPVYAPRNTLYENADEAMTDSIRVVNSALTFHALIEQSSLFLPLSTQDRVWRQMGSARQLRSLKYEPENLYQTSAILATYLDTISLRYRLRDAPATNTLAGFCGDLTNYGRKLTAGALALPFPMLSNVDLIDCLDRFEGELFTQLTPNCSTGSDYVVQSLCVRGIPRDRLKRPQEQAKLQMRMAAYKCSSVSEMFQLYLQCSNHASLAHVCSVAAPMPTRMPFPTEMFEESVSPSGFLYSDATKRLASEKVASVPTLATIQSSSALADTLETLHREARRVKIRKLHRFQGAGLEEDDYNDALEQLLLFKDNYEDNFEL